MSSIKHLDYQGRSILYIDLEGSASDFEVIDLGQKAKKLVKLNRRNGLFVLYNLTGIQFSRQLMQNMKGLMEHAPLVTRRVVYGTDPRFDPLVRQIMQSLGLAAKTRYAEGYPQALNLLIDDAEWAERRRPAGSAAAWQGPEKRHDPSRPPSEADVQAGLDKLLGT